MRKTDETANALCKIMPRIGGPSSRRRALIVTAVQSMLLYGAEVWHRTLTDNTYRRLMEKTQRKVLIRMAYSYRTVSTRALQVICGIVPKGV